MVSDVYFYQFTERPGVRCSLQILDDQVPIPVVEERAELSATAGRQSGQIQSLRHVANRRFLHKDVTTRFQRGRRLLCVQKAGGANVDHVRPHLPKQLFEAGIRRDAHLQLLPSGPIASGSGSHKPTT